MAAPVSEITARRPRALVVDDSQIARYILSGQLKKLGVGVEVADSAEAALRQLVGPLPDVVFLARECPRKGSSSYLQKCTSGFLTQANSASLL